MLNQLQVTTGLPYTPMRQLFGEMFFDHEKALIERKLYKNDFKNAS